MNKSINLFHNVLPLVGLLSTLLISAGCAHNNAPGKAFAEQTVKASSTHEKKGDLVKAVEELKIALVVDPGNSKAREELNRITVKRNLEADKHLKAGIAVRDSNPQGARKEFVAALRIRGDYPEAVTARSRLGRPRSVRALRKSRKALRIMRTTGSPLRSRGLFERVRSSARRSRSPRSPESSPQPSDHGRP